MMEISPSFASRSGISGGPYVKKLTSAKDNIRVEEWAAGAADLASGAKGWSVRKMTLHGGRQEGVDLLVVDNGRLKFTVCP
ncbi:MAG TPA: hypothetical protein VIT18_07900, partial [Terrimicrobiaceae bacterium]